MPVPDLLWRGLRAGDAEDRVMAAVTSALSAELQDIRDQVQGLREDLRAVSGGSW